MVSSHLSVFRSRVRTQPDPVQTAAAQRVSHLVGQQVPVREQSDFEAMRFRHRH